MNTRILALAGVLMLATAPAAAQRTISPGMTEEQVRGTLGAPATSRAVGAWTYLYYHNGCPNRCGSDDVVFLEDGRVVAAVFRTGARRFAGPAPDDAIQAAGGSEGSAEVRQSADPEQPAIVGGIRVGGQRMNADDEEVEDAAPTRAVRIGGRDEPPAARPLRRAGSRESADTTVVTDPPVGGEAQRQARERRVQPNVMPSQQSPSAQRASGEQERRRREQAAPATVIQPQTPPDTTRRTTP
jgi:hypothetical protein